jgi:hypothetical protein
VQPIGERDAIGFAGPLRGGAANGSATRMVAWAKQGESGSTIRRGFDRPDTSGHQQAARVIFPEGAEVFAKGAPRRTPLSFVGDHRQVGGSAQAHCEYRGQSGSGSNDRK